MVANKTNDVDRFNEANHLDRSAKKFLCPLKGIANLFGTVSPNREFHHEFHHEFRHEFLCHMNILILVFTLGPVISCSSLMR